MAITLDQLDSDRALGAFQEAMSNGKVLASLGASLFQVISLRRIQDAGGTWVFVGDVVMGPCSREECEQYIRIFQRKR